MSVTSHAQGSGKNQAFRETRNICLWANLHCSSAGSGVCRTLCVIRVVSSLGLTLNPMQGNTHMQDNTTPTPPPTAPGSLHGCLNKPDPCNDAGGSQAPPRPMSLLQKVAQDAKRRTLTASQGGLGLARELSQAHANAPAGALHSAKPPVHQELLPARSSGGYCMVHADFIIFTIPASVIFTV